MPEFKVSWSYEVGGSARITANSEQEAHEIVMAKLEEVEEDILSLNNKISHRDYSIIDIEEI